MNKKVLFITWDGPQTNYLESLFFPIFEGLQQAGEYRFHVLQFSWASGDKQAALAALAKRKNIIYAHYTVARSPNLMVGSLYTLARGVSFIRRYIAQHKIQVLMPRSTLPAIMALNVKNEGRGLRTVFDADGLPLEERVDFSGLNPNGLQYRFLKRQEKTMIKKADLVLVRSAKAREIHINSNGAHVAPKLFTVSNGRDSSFFKPDSGVREAYREKLNLSPQQLLLVYCGSLGPQYGMDIMVSLFESLLEIQPESKFLLLVPNNPMENTIPENLMKKIHVVSGPFSFIPAWLNAADLALAIREPKFSMQGVAPIKLGEYLLMGLPTIASKGIGDTESMLRDAEFVHLFDHHNDRALDMAKQWMRNFSSSHKVAIRRFALKHFSLERSVEDYKNALDCLAGPE